MKNTVFIMFLYLNSNLSFANGYDTLQLERINGLWNGVLLYLTSEWGYGPISSNIKEAKIVEIDNNVILHDLPYSITSEEILNNDATLIDINNGRALGANELVLCTVGKKCTYINNNKRHEWPIVFVNYPVDIDFFAIVVKESRSYKSTLLLTKGLKSKLKPLKLATIDQLLPFKDGIINGKTYKNIAAFDITDDNKPDIVVAQTSPEYTYHYVLVRDSNKWKIAWQSSLD